MTTHSLKTWPEPFAALVAGRKQFEFRRNDRNYEEADTLRLFEWNPQTEAYTGREEQRAVTYIARGPAFGIPEGYVVMSLAALKGGG